MIILITQLHIYQTHKKISQPPLLTGKGVIQGGLLKIVKIVNNNYLKLHMMRKIALELLHYKK